MSDFSEIIDNIITDLRPLIYNHMCILTASGKTYEQSLRIAAITVHQAYTGDYLREALLSAHLTISRRAKDVLQSEGG